MQDHEKYCPKEISWLRFNHRVLQEAGDASLPLIERLKFIGIFSSNQDEYFSRPLGENFPLRVN